MLTVTAQAAVVIATSSKVLLSQLSIAHSHRSVSLKVVANGALVKLH